MNALDKLDAVQIEADNRISETDRRFCEAHQAAYVDAKASLNELEYMWMDIISRQTETLKPAAAIWNNVQEYTYLHRFSEQDIREKLEISAKPQESAISLIEISCLRISSTASSILQLSRNS